jgi:hypothetical protein
VVPAETLRRSTQMKRCLKIARRLLLDHDLAQYRSSKALRRFPWTRADPTEVWQQGQSNSSRAHLFRKS